MDVERMLLESEQRMRNLETKIAIYEEDDEDEGEKPKMPDLGFRKGGAAAFDKNRAPLEVQKSEIVSTLRGMNDSIRQFGGHLEEKL